MSSLCLQETDPPRPWKGMEDAGLFTGIRRYPWIRWEWWVLWIQLTGQSISLSGQLREELTGAMKVYRDPRI